MLPPTAHEIAIETGAVHDAGGKSHGRPGSDFMVDVIKSLKIDYCLFQSGFELPRAA